MKSNNGYVLGDFSYADITMAIAANTINPIGPPISKWAPSSHLSHAVQATVQLVSCMKERAAHL